MTVRLSLPVGKLYEELLLHFINQMTRCSERIATMRLVIGIGVTGVAEDQGSFRIKVCAGAVIEDRPDRLHTPRQLLCVIDLRHDLAVGALSNRLAPSRNGNCYRKLFFVIRCLRLKSAIERCRGN